MIMFILILCSVWKNKKDNVLIHSLRSYLVTQRNRLFILFYPQLETVQEYLLIVQRPVIEKGCNYNSANYGAKHS